MIYYTAAAGSCTCSTLPANQGCTEAPVTITDLDTAKYFSNGQVSPVSATEVKSPCNNTGSCTGISMPSPCGEYTFTICPFVRTRAKLFITPSMKYDISNYSVGHLESNGHSFISCLLLLHQTPIIGF